MAAGNQGAKLKTKSPWATERDNAIQAKKTSSARSPHRQLSPKMLKTQGILYEPSLM